MIFTPSHRALFLRACAVCLMCGAALAGSVAGLKAKPLDKEACKGLVAEKKSLVDRGVVRQMARGPLWAKENLSSAQMELVKRYLTVDEFLKFRCGEALKVHAQSKPKEKKAAASTAKAATTSAPAASGTASKPKSSASTQ